MYLIFVLALLFCMVLPLRGGGLHNYLTHEAARIFRQAGFKTYLEHPIRLPDGHLNFVDLFVTRGDVTICIEVETSARHVVENAVKSGQANLALWVVVPNKKVQKAVRRRLKSSGIVPGGLRIYFLLLSELEQQVMNYFPCFPSANSTGENRENRKTNQKEGN